MHVCVSWIYSGEATVSKEFRSILAFGSSLDSRPKKIVVYSGIRPWSAGPSGLVESGFQQGKLEDTRKNGLTLLTRHGMLICTAEVNEVMSKDPSLFSYLSKAFMSRPNCMAMLRSPKHAASPPNRKTLDSNTMTLQEDLIYSHKMQVHTLSKARNPRSKPQWCLRPDEGRHCSQNLLK